jgi:hypothetical protein
MDSVNFGLGTPSDSQHPVITGQFDIKFMVQSRQVNADHADSHYTAQQFSSTYVSLHCHSHLNPILCLWWPRQLQHFQSVQIALLSLFHILDL